MEEPVTGRVAAVVLAAGRSERMGREKLLLPVHGRHLVCAPLAAALGSGADPVLCVVAPASEVPPAVLAAGEVFARVLWVVNGETLTGRASSIRAGLEALPEDCEAALFLPGDLPGVRARDVEAVRLRYLEARPAAAAAVERDGAPSHPVLFARELFPRLRALSGDTGARGLLVALGDRVARVPRAAGEPLDDVDTPEAYRRLVGAMP